MITHRENTQEAAQELLRKLLRVTLQELMLSIECNETHKFDTDKDQNMIRYVLRELCGDTNFLQLRYFNVDEAILVCIEEG